MQTAQNIWQVILHHLDKSLTEEESVELDRWLSENDENRKTLEAIEQIWSSNDDPGQQNLLNNLNFNEDWGLIKKKIQQKQFQQKQERIRKFERIKKNQTVYSNLLKAAAIILIAAISVIITLQYTDGSEIAEYEPVFRVISTNAGERANVDLGDGTKVVLNSESRIEVPEIFTNSERYVKVSGQVFFDVISDESRPFFVETDGALIEVIGTSFDVRSYNNENDVRVVVRDGIVEMKSANNPLNKIQITEGNLGMINRETGQLQEEIVDDMDYYTGWLEGRLIFKNSPFHEVLSQIKRWYDIDIQLELSDESLLSKEFTADLKRRSVKNVFEVIAMSMNIEFTINDENDHIVIKN